MRNLKEDQQFVADALNNGPRAFAPIVEKHRQTVFGVALARLGNVDDAEDISQQVFIEAFERLDNLRDPRRLGAWLRSIAVHRCIDLLRSTQSQSALRGSAEGVASREPSPLESMAEKELRERVAEAIAALPPKQREAMTLFYINEYSIRDIATMLGAPVGSVKRRLHDGRRRLKVKML